MAELRSELKEAPEELFRASVIDISLSESDNLELKGGQVKDKVVKSTARKVLDVFLCPFAVVYYSIVIYLLPCVATYCSKCFWLYVCYCCDNKFTDDDFPPNASSIGNWKGKTKEQIEAEIEWIRAPDLFASDAKEESKQESRSKAYLYHENIDPGDISQGSLGNCWLMSALATLAEHPESIKRLFKTKHVSVRGKYEIQIWEGVSKQWVTVTIDDWIPCKKGTNKPIFCKPNGHELWVLLLEKAFAKFCFSYGNLNAGDTSWAFHALTGDYSRQYVYEEKKSWKRMDVLNMEDAKNRRKFGLIVVKEDAKTNIEFFHIMREYLNRDCFLGAGSTGNDDSKNSRGIVKGHGYSVLSAVEKDDFRLVKLRNPWGNFEWEGDWSDNSDLWKKHKKVAKACKWKESKSDDNDGVFWMPYANFLQMFDRVYVCDRSRGMHDISLTVREECKCGVFLGCFLGCLWYWLLCQGPCKYIFARESSDKTVKPTIICGSYFYCPCCLK